MKKGMVLLFVLSMIPLFNGRAAGEEKILKMSTTTSTQASGLLDVLLPALERDTGIQVRVIAKGTGAAIQDGMDGNVDVIFVHDPVREAAFVEAGYGTRRYAVMHNDFVIVGPENDPAGISGIRSGAEAFEKIAAAGATFVSRGDDSGTHAKEQALWQASGVAPNAKTPISPPDSSDWYLSVGQGMGKTLTIADEKQAYTLTDRGTYIKYKFGREVPIDLEILCEGGQMLANPYGVIPVNPEKHAHARYELAETFAQWLVSPRGQKIIGDYKLLGKQLFFPDAQ